MGQESELQRLEKFVEKLLNRFSALKAEKAQLEQDIVERDQEIEELRQTVSSKVNERNEISERVNRIVDQIEEWELSLEQPEEKIETYSAENVEENQAEGDSEDSDEVTEEDESRVQHDLFSMTGSKQ